MASVIEGSSIQGSSYTNKPGQSVGAPDISQGQSPTTTGLAQEGKEQVKRLGGLTRERLCRQLDDKKGQFVQDLHGLADSLESASRGGNIGVAGSLVGGAVGMLHRVSDRLERGSTEELLRDAQAQVRERPGLFIAGCVALGFFAGRLLKI